MAKLPPQPIGVPPGSSYWNDWYEKLRRFVEEATTAVVNFVDLNFTGSNLTQIVTRNHNDLQNFQGGSAGQYYHLTSTQYTDLTVGFTGTGNLVRATSPTLVAPNVGAATGSSLTVTGGVAAGGATGFSSSTFVVNSRNPIFYFGNANPYGMSYFQGTAGTGGIDTIGMHFGTATAAGSTHRFISNGSLEITGNLTVNSTSLLSSTTTLTNAAGAAVGTLNNAPVAGNPTKWITINDNGTTRRIPTW